MTNGRGGVWANCQPPVDRTPFVLRPSSSPRGAFTLIELMLVMAMLIIVLAVAFPSLSNFFHGRDLDSEARRFFALTRYGQSRAISEGVPMILWIDAQQGLYGLEAQAGYTDDDSKAVEFEVDDELQMEVQLPAVTAQSGTVRKTVSGLGNLPMIRFQPDGFIGEASPESISFHQTSDGAIWITQNSNRLSYAIQAHQTPNPLR